MQKTWLAPVVLALTLTALSALAGPPPGAMTDKDPTAYKGMTPAEIARVKKGEIVILNQPENVNGRQMITAAFIFNQPIDTVWTLMTSGWRQQEYLPRLQSSKLIKKWEGHDIIEMHVSILGIGIAYQVLGDRDKSKYRSSWKLNPDFDNDMKQVTGFFQFYYVDDTHTLARYGTWVEVGTFIPGTVQEYMTKRDLPTALAAQKKWVDSNGTYRKPAGT
jgi:hypothetical protein